MDTHLDPLVVSLTIAQLARLDKRVDQYRANRRSYPALRSTQLEIACDTADLVKRTKHYMRVIHPDIPFRCFVKPVPLLDE